MIFMLHAGMSPSPFPRLSALLSLSRWEREGGAKRRKGEGAQTFVSGLTP